MPLRRRKNKNLSNRNKKENGKVQIGNVLKDSFALSNPTLPIDRPSNSCRYENCKTCKQSSANTNIFTVNDCSTTNNNEVKDRQIRLINYREQTDHRADNITNQVDASVYDYTEEFDQVNGETAATTDNECTCVLCKTTYDSPLDLLRHRRDFHKFPKTILPLDRIERYFDYPNRNYCPICKKPLACKNRSRFIKHLKTHTMEATYECRICKKVFKRKDHMRDHEKRHIVQY